MSASAIAQKHIQSSIQMAAELSTNPDHLITYNMLSDVISGNEVLEMDLIIHYKNTKYLGTKDKQHDPAHTMSVAYNTFNLIKLALEYEASNFEAIMCNNYSREILAICMYHDLFDYKFQDNFNFNLKKQIKETLLKIDFTEDQIETVFEVAANIGFRKQKEGKLIPYTKIPKIREVIKSWVSAGDLIEAIGINGIIRSVNCVELVINTVYKDEQIEKGDYHKYLELVINYMEEKLLIIHNKYIEPEIAKRVSQPLQIEMESFYNKYKTNPKECLEDILPYIGSNARYLPSGKNIFEKK